MTTLTLTIGGVDFLPRYKTGSASITAMIQNQGDTLTLELAIKSGQALPSIGSEIIFKDGVRTLFGGFVTKLSPFEYGVGQLIEYQLEASDYTYLLINKSGQAAYENQTLSYIVDDLMSTAIAAGYGMTHVNTAVGPVITTISFNHIPIRQCFEKLAKITGYIWWVDYNKDVHFVSPAAAALAPEQITDVLKNHESISITTDITQVKNDIIVQGGTAESSNYPQVILGDANAREWVLLYTVQNMVSIELDTGAGYVAKTFGVDPKDDETLYYFMYSPDRGSIRCSSGSATPGATHKIRVTYSYPFPVIAEVQDAVSITALKAIEGGDGIHSYTITDSTIISQDQAKQRALQELAQFSQPILSGEFITRTGLLSAGSYFSPGQALSVNLPAWGISTTTVYVIQKVVTTLVESGSAIEYQYQVTFGGRLLGIVDFLLALSTPEEPLDTSGEITKIKAVAEILTITESITRNNNARSIAETTTISESVSKINVTPPFRWAPEASTKKLRWGIGEWG